MGALELKKNIDEGDNNTCPPHLLAFFRNIVNMLLNDNYVWVDDLIEVINEEAKESFVREERHPKE